MKTILTTIAIIFTLCATAQSDTTKEKVYVLKITNTEVQTLYNILEFAKAALPTSQAPANDVTSAIKTIQALQAIISKQYQDQEDKPKPPQKPVYPKK